MSKMVFDATGKYIHPTRYRQIVETASHKQLNTSEQGMVSEDQKHSSVVARVHYQKRRSREIATKAHECLQKLQGEKGTELNIDVRTRLSHSPIGSPAEQDQSVESSPVLPITTTSENQDLTEESQTPREDDDEAKSSSKSECKLKQKRKKLLLFTANEDEYLRAGIKQHGYGQWSAKTLNTSFKRGGQRTLY
jgi:hypothetical protein